MESWPKDLLLGVGMNATVLTLWWLRGLLPSAVATSSADRRVARQEETLGLNVPYGDLETAGSLVLAVAVMVAVAAEIAVDAGFEHATSAPS